jgi:ubiquinone biosynthesis protein COQ9
MRSPLAARQREQLIEAILPDVPFDGWTRRALRQAARRIGISDDEAMALFPRGAAAMVAEFSHWGDREMLRRLAASEMPSSLSQGVALAMRLRFETLLPWREAVRRGLSVLALPPNPPLALRLLYDTVDAIWRGVGDRPTDFSYYTKRATLAGVQAAATLYWLDDRSPEFAETLAFIDRGLADLHRLGSLRGRLAVAAERLPNPLRLLRSTP